MSARLASDMLVSAMVRRVQREGGNAAVLARGDSVAGAILILATERGANPRFFEPMPSIGGGSELVRTGPPDGADAETSDAYWRRRRSSDPDLWVVELDIAAAERFAAETILQG